MSEEKVSENKFNETEERVEIYVEKGSMHDEPNLLISINGKNYLLPRGKKSSVPKYVADEYHRSLRAAEARDEQIEKLLGASK